MPLFERSEFGTEDIIRKELSSLQPLMVAGFSFSFRPFLFLLFAGKRKRKGHYNNIVIRIFKRDISNICLIPANKNLIIQ